MISRTEKINNDKVLFEIIVPNEEPGFELELKSFTWTISGCNNFLIREDRKKSH